MKTAALVSLVIVLGSAAPAAAQIPVGTKVGEAPPAMGTYNSLGNRDPFVTLVASRRTNNPTPRIGGTGLGSFYVDDVVVTGIQRVGDVRFAILQSPDRQSYTAKPKDRLADAVVKSIDAEGVTFVEVLGPGQGGRPREVRKLLNANEVKR
jgi:hypothetical protein